MRVWKLMKMTNEDFHKNKCGENWHLIGELISPNGRKLVIWIIYFINILTCPTPPEANSDVELLAGGSRCHGHTCILASKLSNFTYADKLTGDSLSLIRTQDDKIFGNKEIVCNLYVKRTPSTAQLFHNRLDSNRCHFLLFI